MATITLVLVILLSISLIVGMIIGSVDLIAYSILSMMLLCVALPLLGELTSKKTNNILDKLDDIVFGFFKF